MPPMQYSIFHPNSKMNAQQKRTLIDALSVTLN